MGMRNLTVLLDPEQRIEHMTRVLALDCLSHVREEVGTAYCPISLTSVPQDQKPWLKERQQILMKMLGSVGIAAYDPGSSKDYSPDLDLSSPPPEVYSFDAARVIAGEYFTGHRLLPSDGIGVESQIASRFGKKSVIIFDRNIRVTRMLPFRAIYLSCDNFADQADEFKPVFEMLEEFDVGMGLVGILPTLVGFPRDGGALVDLENAVYTEFPHLQFKYDGTVPIAKLRVENPEIFYESGR
ncbi:hypothetical protein HOL21_04175 [Candidatus Woesearchaeota archaeon]|nr:hypothetical protein [Candidatus Woesearchaeota archaeon]